MATVPLSTVVQHVRSMTSAEVSDRDLLIEYIDASDETAFAAIIRRHGRVVLGVCRRLLGPGPDADDAFQATFFVLARKAASIRKQASLASWLHGVAHRVASQLRAKRARQRQRETCIAGQIGETDQMRADPSSRVSLREMGVILDEELQRLPSACRDALVLCLMENVSHPDAATRLGCPLGTLKSRLQRGRELLRQRLEHRGIGLTGIALTVLMAEQGRAAVSGSLLQATLFGAAHNAATPAVAALAKTVLATMAGKMKALLAVIVLTGVAMAGVGVGAYVPSEEPTLVALNAEPPKPPIQAKLDKNVERVDGLGDPLPVGAVSRLGTKRWRHDNLIRYAAFLPDGKAVVSVSQYGVIHVWDFPAGKELRRFGPGMGQGSSREQWCQSASLSPDGTLLAGCFGDAGVEFWNVHTGKEMPAPTGLKNRSVAALTYIPDGKHLATLERDGAIRVWDLVTDKEVRSFGAPLGDRSPGAKALVISPDGKAILAVFPVLDVNTWRPTIQMWDPVTGNEKALLKTKTTTLALPPVFSPDSKLIAYGTVADGIVIVDGITGREVRKIEHEKGAISLAFSHDCKKLFGWSQTDWTIREWDVATGKQLRQLGKPQHREIRFENICTLTLSPDGKSAMIVDFDHALRFMDLSSGKAEELRETVLPVRYLDFSPDGKHVVTQCQMGGLHRWDIDSGKEVAFIVPPKEPLPAVASYDGRYYAQSQSWNISREPHPWAILFDAETGKELGKVPSRNLAFGPDGKTLVVNEWHRKTIGIYDLPSLTLRCSMPTNAKPTPFVNSYVRPPRDADVLMFSSDGKLIAASKENGVIRIWETGTGRLKSEIRARAWIVNGAIAPDGRVIALEESDGLVTIWEIASGKQRQVFAPEWSKEKKKKDGANIINAVNPSGFDPYRRHEGTTRTLAFSPDGKHLAYAGLDKKVHLWNVNSGKTVAEFRGHSGGLLCVAFSADGTRLASGSGDTTALVWNVSGLK